MAIHVIPSRARCSIVTPSTTVRLTVSGPNADKRIEDLLRNLFSDIGLPKSHPVKTSTFQVRRIRTTANFLTNPVHSSQALSVCHTTPPLAPRIPLFSALVPYNAPLMKTSVIGAAVLGAGWFITS